MENSVSRVQAVTLNTKQNASASSRQVANDIWKSVIEDILDPSSQMTEKESKAYENKIMTKLKSGKNLSTEELNYLKIHNPTLYRSAMRVKQKKEALKKKLEHCSSKEEAEKVISDEIGKISDKDPDKEYIVAGLKETAKEYKKTPAYARLPQKEEENQAEKKQITPIQEVLDELPTFDTKG